MNTKKLGSLFALVASASLVACGGGGSDSSSAAAAPALGIPASPAPAPVPALIPAPAVNPDLVTSVTLPTYAAGTPEKGGWDLLMAQRSTCGFGLLQQDTRLDVASEAHSNYLVQNSLRLLGTAVGHFEDPTYPFFTGNAPGDRATAAGYNGNVFEILAIRSILTFSVGQQFTVDEALGATSMRDLIETVYHARGAFWAGRSGGIGAVAGFGPAAQSGVTQSQYRITSEISSEANAQKLGTSTVASFPCNGTVGINGTFAPATESPNPFPSITDTAVKYGTPLYFKADEGSSLVITTGTVTKVSDGSALTLSQLNKANDPAAEITSNEVFLVPTSALAKASSYSVHVVGTVNGTPFTKDLTFSTAPSTE